MSPEPTAFFLRKGDGAVYGPVDTDTLPAWAKQGRVAPDDALSADRITWQPAPNVSQLEMNWLVELDDGSQYGPVHLLALRELTADGSITMSAKVANRATEETCSLGEALGQKPASPPAAKTPDKSLPTVSAPVEAVQPAPAPKPADEPAGGIPDSDRGDWKEMAIRKDSSEREALKWKTMYEDERARNRKQEQTLTERMEEMRKSEMAARMQLELAERKLRGAEENLRLFRQTMESNAAGPEAGQIAPLIESYNELSQRYDKLMQLLTEKSAEVQNVLASRKLVEEHADEQIKQMREIAQRDRADADEARRRLAEFEQNHIELVKAYRELNDRVIRMRQEGMQAPSASPAGEAHLPLKRSHR